MGSLSTFTSTLVTKNVPKAHCLPFSVFKQLEKYMAPSNWLLKGQGQKLQTILIAIERSDQS